MLKNQSLNFYFLFFKRLNEAQRLDLTSTSGLRRRLSKSLRRKNIDPKSYISGIFNTVPTVSSVSSPTNSLNSNSSICNDNASKNSNNKNNRSHLLLSAQSMNFVTNDLDNFINKKPYSLTPTLSKKSNHSNNSVTFSNKIIRHQKLSEAEENENLVGEVNSNNNNNNSNDYEEMRKAVLKPAEQPREAHKVSLSKNTNQYLYHNYSSTAPQRDDGFRSDMNFYSMANINKSSSNEALSNIKSESVDLSTSAPINRDIIRKTFKIHQKSMKAKKTFPLFRIFIRNRI